MSRSLRSLELTPSIALAQRAWNPIRVPDLRFTCADIRRRPSNENVDAGPRQGEARHYDLVGPICETGDFLAKGRELVLAEGDLLAVRSAGAYGFVMSSNYNTRGRAAEVLVDGDQAFEVRRRETLAELYAGESLLPQ